MNRILASVSLALFSLVSGSACGNSPLLHHLNADEIESQSQIATPNECPLQFSKNQICGSIQWEGPVSDEKENTFTLTFDQEVSAEVAVQLWMPSMGHGSSPVSIQKVGPGKYLVTRVFFIMPGDWDIRVQIKKNGQLDEQAIISISL